VDHLKVLLRHSPGGAEEYHESLSQDRRYYSGMHLEGLKNITKV
jgi:hypothetical protein